LFAASDSWAFEMSKPTVRSVDDDFAPSASFDEDLEGGCDSKEPTPRAFAFRKRGMFPKEQQEWKDAEELVEIKPRQRDQHDVASGYHRASIDASAFDDVPPAEVYDPSWSTTPLRAEAGQLGKKQAGGGAARQSLLPNAFTLGSSADLDDDDDDGADRDSLDDLVDSHIGERSASMNSSNPHSRSIYAKGKRGALSFLARKKRENVYNLFIAEEKPEAVAELLVVLLQSHYAADVSSKGPPEIKARVRFQTEDPTFVTSIAITIERTQDSVDLTKVVLRRNKSDKPRSTPAAIHSFCVELASRYISAKPEITILKAITDTGAGDS
jgi:hypothetical protein